MCDTRNPCVSCTNSWALDSCSCNDVCDKSRLWKSQKKIEDLKDNIPEAIRNFINKWNNEKPDKQIGRKEFDLLMSFCSEFCEESLM